MSCQYVEKNGLLSKISNEVIFDSVIWIIGKHPLASTLPETQTKIEPVGIGKAGIGPELYS